MSRGLKAPPLGYGLHGQTHEDSAGTTSMILNADPVGRDAYGVLSWYRGFMCFNVSLRHGTFAFKV